MKARLVEPERRVCRLRAGEAKRLPRIGGLLGFYVACPSCGRLNIVLAEGQELVDEGSGELRALAPGFDCESPLCAKHVHVRGGEFVVTDARG